MLSTRIFKSGEAAGKYYSHGDYYGSEGEGIWYGEGAKELGLSGEFKASSDKTFNNLLQGIMPNGEVLGRKNKDGIEHCPGVDLTFSAPKSFSIQMLVFANKEEREAMEQAMNQAVKSTLSYIEEKGYAVSRFGHAGIQKEAAHKLIYANFSHTTNRNLEPQAHVHCFLANSAMRSDGEYRSMSFDQIIKNNKFLGQVFRNELALETKKLGYEIIPTMLSDGSSAFELANIDNKLNTAFSTRRQEIEALCKFYNVTSKEGRDNIVINSRKAKELKTEGELSSAWKELANQVEKEIDLEKTKEVIAATQENALRNTSDRRVDNTFDKALNYIIDKCKSTNFGGKYLKNITFGHPSLDNEEKIAASPLSLENLSRLCIEDVTHKNSVFSTEELAKKTLKFAIGNYTIREIEAQHQKFEQEGILIRRGNFYTSKALLTSEREILKHAKNTVGASKAILKEKYFSVHYDKFYKREFSKNKDFQMNEQQKQVVKHVLTRENKIITVEGLPGVGKSTVLNAVRDIAGHKINKVLSLVLTSQAFEGIAPTASAAKTLGESAKVESNTIHSFIGKYQGYLEGRGKNSINQVSQELRNTIIFVDEASLISTNIMHKLTSLQNMLKFRMVLVGDTKQLSAVEAGKPFEQILQIIPSVKLNEIVRQKLPEHKEAVVLASEGKVKETFAIHENNIIKKENLSAEASSAFLKSNLTKRDKTLLISPTKNLRDDINDNIRKGLVSEGTLKGPEIGFKALRQKDMSVADYQFAQSFSVQDTIKFHKACRNLISKDEYVRVKKVNNLTNSLILEKENGKEVLYHLRKEVNYQSKFEVFNDRDIKLTEGLRIVFTKNNKNHGLVNSETALIKKIDDKNQNLLLQFEDKSIRAIKLSELRHIEYGYCVTIHSSQGKTFENTIAAINNHPLLNEQKSWLVSVSRHKKDLTIFVEDKQRLQENLLKNDGTKLSAIDLVSMKNSEINSSKISSYTNINKKKILEGAKIDNTKFTSKVSKESISVQEFVNQAKESLKPSERRRVSIVNNLSGQDIHDRLCDNITSLAPELLKSISNKKIEITNSNIKCGSINIELKNGKRGLWQRFSTGRGGNLFDLIKEAKGFRNIKESIEWSKNYLGMDTEPNISSNRRNKLETTPSVSVLQKQSNQAASQSEFKVLMPVPESAPKFNASKTFYYMTKNQNNKIESVHEYRNIKSQLCGYVVRIKNTLTNDKTTMPVVLVEKSDGKATWKSKGFGEGRCLYNEHKLAGSKKPVLVVEGEKTADAASKLYPDFNVISWSGGAQGYRKSDWSVLKDKNVKIWPDNDKPGIEAATNIKSILEANKIAKVRVIDLKKIENLPEKWDLADNIPKDVRKHQITGSIYDQGKIDNNIRKENVCKDYADYRRDELSRESINKEYGSFNHYIKEQAIAKFRLLVEKNLVIAMLDTKNVLSLKDESFIKLASDKMLKEDLKIHDLHKDLTTEKVAENISSSLSLLYQNTSKFILLEVAKVATTYSEKLINGSSRSHNLIQTDLPVIAMSLASDIITYHNKTKNLSKYNNDIDVIGFPLNKRNYNSSEHSQNLISDSSLHLIKSSFNSRLKQNQIIFEKQQIDQQLQIAQGQISKQYSMEI